MTLLLGPYGSPATFADAAIAEKYKIPMVEANGAARKIFAQGYRCVFGILSPAEDYAASMRLLLIDEPSLGLAPLMVRQLMEVVDRLRGEGSSVLLVEQDVAVALAHADRGDVLEGGHVVLADAAPAPMADARVRAAYLGITGVA